MLHNGSQMLNLRDVKCVMKNSVTWWDEDIIVDNVVGYAVILVLILGTMSVDIKIKKLEYAQCVMPKMLKPVELSKSSKKIWLWVQKP